MPTLKCVVVGCALLTAFAYGYNERITFGTDKPDETSHHEERAPQDTSTQGKSETKPRNSEWIKGRGSEMKLNLISWLIDGCSDHRNCDVNQKEDVPEFQTFDGFFNNLFKVDLGAVDTALLRRVPPVYDDGVYLPVTKNRINPFHASDSLMKREPKCKDTNGNSKVACGSTTGKTAFLVYFGQQVVEEILDAQRAGCPPEYFNIEIPEKHPYREQTDHKKMPFLRSRWDQSTGHSPGNPRQQLNEITPWIDGGLVYGTSKGWADVLRTNSNGTLAEHGLLASQDDKGLFPVQNTVRLPMANPPPPGQPANDQKWTEKHETARVNRFFVLGNPRGNENAFLLSFGIVLFRWHNHIAKYLQTSRKNWSGERIFQEARKWVIGTYQHIVVDDWLPQWLGEGLDDYTGYDPSVDPQIEQFFQTAAMRFGHTLVTPGAYLRDYKCGDCKPIPFYGRGDAGSHDPKKKPNPEVDIKAVRTCNIFWRPQEPITMKYETNPTCHGVKGDVADIDRLLMGMASQRAEREDNMIVEDLRGRVFGPLEFSRRDLMAVNIQRGRDHGTPDYNTAREAFNLSKIDSVKKFVETDTKTPMDIIEEMEKIHKINCSANCARSPWDNIDVWTGGILETSSLGPGPLFRAIIKDQFTRIRNADRFWYENENWKIERFDKNQIKRIKQLRVFDLIVSVTQMLEDDIQENPFQVPSERNSPNIAKCGGNKNWEKSTCEHFVLKNAKVTNDVNFSCWHFPQLDSDYVKVEPCTNASTYDYFSGSDISYILTFVCIGIAVFGIGSLVPMTGSLRQKHKQNELVKVQKDLRRSLRISGQQSGPITAVEWLGNKEGIRAVALLVKEPFLIEVRSFKGELLRSMDFSRKSAIELVQVSDGVHLVVKNTSEYDCVLKFDGSFIRDSFVHLLKDKFSPKEIITQTASLKQSLSSALTKNIRLARLENFFKIVFAQAFHIDQPSGEKDSQDPKRLREAIHTELTRAEFSDALGMESGSLFVQKMFDLVDRDKNGFISFREFLDMLIIFAKGSAEDKAKLMFEMYDISRTGMLSMEEFKSMIRSMVEAANAEISNDDIEDLVRSMVTDSGLQREVQVSLQHFQALMSQYKDTLGSAQLNFSGVNVPESQPKNPRQSYHEQARATVVSIYGRPPEPEPVKERVDIRQESDVVLPRNVQKRNVFFKWIEQYRLQIFWGIMYTLVVLAVFAERAYTYSVEREHGGLRHIAGYGVTVTRGAASAIMFCFATLLITMCRNLITHLRETFLHRFIPFDSFLSMHKYIALLGLLFIFVHVIGHSVNFYHISTQTASDLSCLFRDYYRSTHVLPKFHYWCFQTLTGITGILLVINATLIYAFATSYARSHAFRMFWITHATYPIFYVLMILHGLGRLVQEPIFANFLIGPLILFIIDRLVAISRKKVEIPVIRAELLPSNVTKLEFARPSGFDYKSGQWVRIACLKLNSNEYHPFTLSSAPHEPLLSVHIRAVGPFTANIRHVYETSLPKLYLDGPYGEGHQDWWRYEVSVLVGGGIGVTPFASILKDAAANANPRSCKKIYFLWVTRTQKQFEWLVDIIREVEEHKLISVHVFITQIYNKFDLRTVLLYICERHFQKVSNKSLFTGLRSMTHFGRPNFTSIFKSLRSLHPNVSKFGVFSCGPFSMTKKVDEACNETNNLASAHEAIFQHHFENF